MIEAVAGAAKAGTEAVTLPAKEGLARPSVGEVGGSKGANGTAKFDVGGDFRSILSALKLDPAALGIEVRGGGVAEAMEHVPLKDSKGEIRHYLVPQEAEHYERIGLTPREVNGRECLTRDDVAWEQRDVYGQTNLERAEQGLAPLDPQGRPYELHHVEQRSDGMLAELTRDEHRGVGVDRILHNPNKTSEIDRAEFDHVRADHWRARAAEVRS